MWTETDMNAETERLLRPPEAGRYVGLSESTLAKLRVYGGGPQYLRLSARAIGYRRADLDKWLIEKSFSSTSEYDR